MSVKENLIAAKALIDTPEKWGKGQGFIEPVGCLCAESACAKVSRSGRHEAWYALAVSLPAPWRDRYFEEDIPVHDFNDDPATTHADIMDLFDRAIEASE